MPALSEIFDKRKILLYQNESLDLDHYYQEPCQDEDDEIKEMGKPYPVVLAQIRAGCTE